MMLSAWDGFFLRFGQICCVVILLAVVLTVLVLLALAHDADHDDGDPSDEDELEPAAEQTVYLVVERPRQEAPPAPPPQAVN